MHQGIRTALRHTATRTQGKYKRLHLVRDRSALRHVPFEVDRVNSPAGSPSLTQMATKAVKFLQKNDNGFFLLVRRCSRQWDSN